MYSCGISIAVFGRNEESPFRALTHSIVLSVASIFLVCRNEESPFRALTQNSSQSKNFFSSCVEMKKARLGR